MSTWMYLGVDPGADGAFACVSEEGAYAGAVDMPKPLTGAGVHSILNEFGGKLVACCFELVSAAPIQGRRQGAQTMFTFGKNTGRALGVIEGRRIPVHEITPAQWKREMRVTKDKERCRLRAIQLFPEAEPDLRFKKNAGRAEALLMAEWMRRFAQEGKVKMPRYRLVRSKASS